MIFEARESAHRGITFGPPQIELDKLRAWKNSIVDKLAGGVGFLAKKRGVQVLTGRGYFEGSQSLRVETAEGQQFVTFDKAIVAVGSKAALPKAFDLGNPRVMTSTEALEVEEIPEDLLVVGGGYIGMELGSVYANLGSKVVVVEALAGILTGADPTWCARSKIRAKNFRELRFNTKVTQMSTKGKKSASSPKARTKSEKEEFYDRVLVSVGRVPRLHDLGLENTKVEQDERGFIKVNDKQETADPPSWPSATSPAAFCWRTKRARKRASPSKPSWAKPSTSAGVIIPAVVFTDPKWPGAA
jgi:dihydrolipoamide dehydrogenase